MKKYHRALSIGLSALREIIRCVSCFSEVMFINNNNRVLEHPFSSEP